MVWSNQAPTSLVFPPGATTGARLVIDQTGIRVYAPNGLLLLVIGSDPTTEPVLAIEGVIKALTSNNAGAIQTGGVAYGAQNQQFSVEPVLSSALVPYDSLAWQWISPSGRLVVDAYESSVGFGSSPPGPSNQFQFHQNSPLGAYYHEEAVIANGQALPAGAFTTLVGMTPTNLASDYVSGWNAGTGTWTCPATGYYSVDFSCWSSNFSAAGEDFTLIIQRNGTQNLRATDMKSQNSGHGVFGQATLINRYLNKNDTLNFQVGNGDTVAQTIVTSATEPSEIIIHKAM